MWIDIKLEHILTTSHAVGNVPAPLSVISNLRKRVPKHLLQNYVQKRMIENNLSNKRIIDKLYGFYRYLPQNG